MRMTRREYLAATAALPLAAPVAASPLAGPLDRSGFDLAPGKVYLDSGTMHPVSRGGRAAVAAYLAARAEGHAHLDEDAVRAAFARLVGADPDEIAFVQSTTMGEQLVLKALGLPQRGAHIVTDTLHFFGSFPLYEGLATQGCEVTWLRPRDGRIAIEDMDRAIRPGTKLVALSLVSTFNGFEHDLKAVCDIAHARGALVYADIVHAAGCVPVDLHASGIDFAACASYKWLMGDFGLGFLYARKDRQERLQRTQYGYYGIADFTPHAYPLDAPAAPDDIADYSFQASAMGHFAYGTYSHMGVALLAQSLGDIGRIGVPAIQAHAQPLVDRLKQQLPRMGYQVATPPEAKTPFVTCIVKDASTRLQPALDKAGVTITVSRNRFRVTPSVFNGMDDVEKLLAALKSS